MPCQVYDVPRKPSVRSIRTPRPWTRGTSTPFRPIASVRSLSKDHRSLSVVQVMGTSVVAISTGGMSSRTGSGWYNVGKSVWDIWSVDEEEDGDEVEGKCGWGVGMAMRTVISTASSIGSGGLPDTSIRWGVTRDGGKANDTGYTTYTHQLHPYYKT